MKLNVNDKVYAEVEVSDGFYDSIASLKTKAHVNLELSENYNSAREQYSRIIDLCKKECKLPKLTLEKSREILDAIRPAVNDLYSITGYHYKYAGQEGVLHFQALINATIDNLNNLSVEQFNMVWA